MKKNFLFIFFYFCFSYLGYSQNGLDKSFGSNGKKSIALTKETSNQTKLIINALPDSLNRITLVTREIYDTGSKLTVSRRLENGQLDTSFGIKGSFSINLLDSNINYYQLAKIDKQGRIVFAGLNNTFFYDIILCRYWPNGSIDTSFSNDGYQKYAWSIWGDYINSLALQEDGKILVSGSVNLGYNSDFAVMRVLTNGLLDSTFNKNGYQFLNVVQQDQNPILNLLPNGKYLLSGAYLSMDSAGLIISQLNNNGSLDTTFGKKGFVTWTYGRGDHYFIDMQVLENGKYLGIIKKPGDESFYRVTRFLATGLIDSSFGSNGNNIHALEPQQIIPDSVTGYYATINRKIVRFNNNGTLDSTFDHQIIGIPDYDFNQHTAGGFFGFFVKMPNTSFRAIGGKALGNQEGHNAIAIVTAFSKQGKYLYSFGDSSILIFEGEKIQVLMPLKVLASKPMASGGMLIAGLTKVNGMDNLVVIKLDVDGNQVKSFGEAGMFLKPLRTLNNFYCDILELPTKEICIAHNNFYSLIDTTSVIKLDSNGKQDFSFWKLYAGVGYYNINGVFLNLHYNTILLSSTGYGHYNFDGTNDQIYMNHGSVKPNLVYVDKRNRIFIGTDSSLWRTDSMGTWDITFGTNYEFIYQHNYICNGNSYSAYLNINSIIDDSLNNKYIIGGSIKRTCPNNFTQDIWITVDNNGKVLNNKPLFTLDNFSGKTQQVKQLKNSFLVHDYWTPAAGNPPVEKGVVYKINYQGDIDLSFGNNGKIQAQEAMYKITDSSSYLGFSKIIPIDNAHSWWVQGYKDSVYLNKIVVKDVDPKLDFVSDSVVIKKPYSIKLTPSFNYPIKSYHWQITSSDGGQSSFSFGTDSSYANPRVLIQKPGNYDVTLKVTYLDTSISLTKKSYIQYLKPIGLENAEWASSIKVYPNPASSNLLVENANNDHLTVAIFDLIGNKLMQQSTNKFITDIDISTIQIGLYFMTVSNEKNESTTLKFIKE